MISVAGLSMNFGKKVLFENVSLKFVPGNCYGIIGANGTGKSTFIKILTHEVEQSLGQVSLDPGKRLGWLRQDITHFDDQTVISVALRGHQEVWKIQQELDAIYAKGDSTDADMKRMSELQDRFEHLDGYNQEPAAAQVLTDLGVEPSLHQKLLGEIDTAKKVRVLLAQAVFSKPDVLLLDEPTNNLDIPAIVWLEQFLADYDGVIIVVSHDRHFLNRCAPTPSMSTIAGSARSPAPTMSIRPRSSWRGPTAPRRPAGSSARCSSSSASSKGSNRMRPAPSRRPAARS